MREVAAAVKKNIDGVFGNDSATDGWKTAKDGGRADSVLWPAWLMKSQSLAISAVCADEVRNDAS